MFQFTSGSILGRYQLLVPIASGGMAEVWAARLHGTRGFTKLVAIKTIRRGVMDDTRLEQMLLAEAHLASRIQHPNVVSTIELGEQDETLFLVMEWADAEPLSTLIKETDQSGGIPIDVGVNIIAQACKGVHSAHELTDDDGNLLGVVHRDISPQNVLVTYAGVVKLVDFGIAKATQGASSMTEDGEVKGKLAYMSPEQVRGEEVDRRTDIFALGTLLFFVTTGQHPFKGAHPGETLAKLFANTPILPPSRLVDDYPKALEQVVLKALSKDREQRYATAHEMLLALEEAVPEARGIESKVAEFLRYVSGSHGDQRRRHIRTAGELLDDRQDGAILHGGTSTSLSAMSIGSTGSRLALGTVAPKTEEISFRRGIASGWIAAGVAVAGAIVGLWFGTTGSSSNDAEVRDAAAAAQLPLLTTPGATALPMQRPSDSITDDGAAGDAGARDESRQGDEQSQRDGDEKTKRRAKKPAPRKSAAARRVAPSKKAVAKAPPELKEPSFSEKVAERLDTQPKATAPPSTPSKPKEDKKDSWDPSTFGGRL